MVWKLPVYATILKFLTNPIYGGAYAHGRTRTQTRLQDGRRRVQRGLRRSPEDWEVLIIDHHQGYIAWDEYQQNQRLIAENTNMRGQMARGAVRPGPALLAGLLRCGHCGRKLHVAYSGAPPGKVARYHCRGAMGNHGAGRCISFGSLRIEMAVCREMLRLLDPLGIAAALGAIEVHRHEVSDKRRQIELALDQARFEATRARRQYDAVDPDNRLVAGELEHRWNERLRAVQRLEEELASLDAEPNAGLTAIERERLLALGHDLGAAWIILPPRPRSRSGSYVQLFAKSSCGSRTDGSGCQSIGRVVITPLSKSSRIGAANTAGRPTPTLSGSLANWRGSCRICT